MNAFVLKIIACIAMFIDHIGYAIFNGNPSYLNYIGRISFPIFAFQISEGYIHTKNIKNYIIRLTIFAIISQVPFMLFHSIISNDFCLNVIFTLLLGLLSILIYDKINKIIGIITTLLFAIIAELSHCDYGFYGVTIIFLFFVFGKNKLWLSFSYVLATIVHFGYSILKFYKNGPQVLIAVSKYYIPYAICTLLSLIFILSYNKKKGPNTKYLLYLFYPLHMLLIYAISFVLQN